MLDQNLRKAKPTEIVELETQSLGLLARLLHKFALETEDKIDRDCALLTIEHLNYQTSVVKLEPKEHLSSVFLASVEKKNQPAELEIVER